MPSGRREGDRYLRGEVLAKCCQMPGRVLCLKGCCGVQCRIPQDVTRRYGTLIVLKIYSFPKSYFC